MKDVPRRNVVAIDLGAESGRVVRCEWDGQQGRLQEVHRFSNAARQVGGHWVWNVERLWQEMLKGLATAGSSSPGPIDSIGIDGWAVDYVLLDRSGKAIREAFCYRDPRSSPQMERAFSRVPKQRIYEITGIQFLSFNTVYQLLAHIEEFPQDWEQATCWLNLPEYFLFRLSGVRASEYTNATHTQLVNIASANWSAELAGRLGLDLEKFPTIVQPGSVLGRLRPELTGTPNLSAAVVIAPACHDTGSAVAGIPFSSEGSVFISSGTWSLVGTVLPKPVVSAEALRLNFTNEGGICGTTRLLKNVIGLWLLQQCLEEWNTQGVSLSAVLLTHVCGEVETEGPFFVADSETFLVPGNMPDRINHALERQGFQKESRPVELARIIFRSLARRYAEVIREIQEITSKRFHRICIVGGGVKNEALNTLTERFTGLEVLRGPSESAAAGNAAVQIGALEGARSLEEVRQIASCFA